MKSLRYVLYVAVLFSSLAGCHISDRYVVPIEGNVEGAGQTQYLYGKRGGLFGLWPAYYLVKIERDSTSVEIYHHYYKEMKLLLKERNFYLMRISTTLVFLDMLIVI